MSLIALEIDTEAAEAVSKSINSHLDQLGNMTLDQLLDTIVGFLPKLFWAAAIFAFGYVLILALNRFIKKILSKSSVDPTLHSFIISTSKIVFLVLLCITCVGLMDINITPLVAALGALGLAFSLSIQGTLSNIAGGVSVLFSHPFAKGDYVDISGTTGTIMELGLVYTRLKTADNKQVYLPNGDVAKATITNYSAEPQRRLDLTFPVKISTDFEAVKSIMLEIADASPLALKTPAPAVRITDQTFAYVKMTLMVWVETDNLYILSSELTSSIRTAMSQKDM